MAQLNPTADFRVGVVGAGMMGADHIKRIASSISGATVSAVIEPDEGRAQAALANAPGAQAFSRVEDAIAAGAVDGLLVATPGSSTRPSSCPPSRKRKVPSAARKPFSSCMKRTFCPPHSGTALVAINSIDQAMFGRSLYSPVGTNFCSSDRPIELPAPWP